jgi:hypothetical protein
LGYIFFGKISSIIGNRSVIRLSLLALIIQPLVCIFIPLNNYLPYVAFVIIFSAFFNSGWLLSVFNSSLSISPKSHRSLYLGIFTALNAISAIAAPIIGGFLIDLYKDHPIPVFGIVFYPAIIVFIISSVLILIGLIVFPDYKDGDDKGDFSMKDLVLYPLFYVSQRLLKNFSESKSPIETAGFENSLHDIDLDNRLSAIEGLGNIGNDHSLEVLISYYDEANILEKKEIIKSLKNFSNESVKDFLLKILESKDNLFKSEAVRSLSQYADVEIKDIVMKKINRENDIDMFILYLELLSNYHILDIIPLVLARYNHIKDQKRKNIILFYLSILLDIKNDFYAFVNIETSEEQEKRLEENFKKIFEILKRSLNVSRNKNLIIEIDEVSKKVLDILVTRQITTLKPYKNQIVSMISKVMLTTNPFITEFINYFFNKKNINYQEIEILFLEIIKYLNIRSKLK